MPNYFTGNIDKWLLLSESETDFAILFVRSWIPFNAWYCNNYGTSKDRECIDKIKTDNNLFRARMIALLTGRDNESERFKAHVGQLHELLERHPIPDATPQNRISFANIYFRDNPITSTAPQAKRNLEHKSERQTTGAVRAVVVTKRAPFVSKYDYSHPKYDFDHFKSDVGLSSLNEEQAEFLADCFSQINPRKKENLVSSTKKEALVVGGIYFRKNTDHLSQALVEVLYSLRCKLFHGELQPSRDNLKVYEPAYHILRMLLNSLR